MMSFSISARRAASAAAASAGAHATLEPAGAAASGRR